MRIKLTFRTLVLTIYSLKEFFVSSGKAKSATKRCVVELVEMGARIQLLANLKTSGSQRI